MPGPQQVARMNTAELRENFLLENLFTPGDITMYALDLDRVLVGGAVPADAPLELEAPPAIAADYFNERRELGVLNIGGPGTVAVDGELHRLDKLDMLYVGRGVRSVSFASDVAQRPARFYLVSYPAHAPHPTRRIAAENAESAELGTTQNANRRSLAKYIHPGALPTAQLVMGVTSLHDGSVWNTMPPHTHQRRTEIYLYFDIPADAVVFHLLGTPNETRNLVVRDGQVALSPSWSVHAGCGTSNYRFCWAMGGENQVFSDMQGVDMKAIK
ncbi:MAG TPA: 5-dehydro-4-deoxy-D-glucuronate isomerase, partial [Longimicrobiales bacterium]